MPSVTFNGNTYNCVTAYKGPDYVHLVDSDGTLVVAFDGVTDFSKFSITGGNWSTTSDKNCHLAVFGKDGAILRGKTADSAIIGTYTHSTNGLTGSGENGKFKATTTGTISSIKVNGKTCSVKCGEETSMDLVAGCWYTFILDGTTVNFNSGGAGGGLNFKVVGGTSAPASPKENMIWVNTSVPITGYYFSVTQPENMLPGEVWVSIGTSSTVAFSATKKNPIMIYPINASQYVDGALVGVGAYSYQNGKWVSWITYLYRAGDECTDLTGGWQGRAWKSIASDGAMADPFVLKRYETYMHCSLGQNRTGVVEIKNDISFKGKKKLNLECSNVVNTNTSIGLRMAIINRNASYWFTNAASIVSLINGVNYISLEKYQNDNKYDVIICAVTNEGSAEASFDMLNVWLE